MTSISIPIYILDPAGCSNQLTYKVTRSDESDLPIAFTLSNNGESRTINV